jgi:L-alanine-DL-glutamate epimerase-like enolase superfamily enzyme
MRITDIDVQTAVIPMAKPFRVSLGAIAGYESVFVRIKTDEGLTGYGEGCPFTCVTGETCVSVSDAVSLFAAALTGLDPFSIDHIHAVMDRISARNGTAKAAIDMALYDIMGKASGLPLYKLLGGHLNTVETDMTISIDAPEIMGEKAAAIFGEGYRTIKVKAGGNRKDDLDAIRLISEAAPDAVVNIDANQGWNAHEAIDMCKAYAAFGVSFIEQPLPYWDIDGMAYVRSRSPIPIMADESCFTPQDAYRIVKAGAADMINIKLMKCGGLYRAMQINAVAQAAGIPCMVGCMSESKLSIAAGAALAVAHPNITHADLDGFTQFEAGNLLSEGFRFTPPVIDLGDAPGIGVTVNFP